MHYTVADTHKQPQREHVEMSFAYKKGAKEKKSHLLSYQYDVPSKVSIILSVFLFAVKYARRDWDER